MKINTIHFTEQYYPEIGEISTIVDNYVYWLNAKYGKSEVVAPYVSDSHDHKSYNIIRVKGKKGLEVIKKQDIDLIHVHSPLEFGEMALKIAREKKVPIVATFYPQFYYGVKERVRNRNMRKAIKFFKNIDFLYTTTPMMVDILNYYGYNKKIRLLRGGTDLIYDESNRQKDKDYVERLHNFHNETNILLYVGSLTWDKNLKLLIDSLSNLLDFRQMYKMIFVGDGPARNEMMKYIENSKLKKFVIFTGEISERTHLMKYYAQANLLLYPLPYDSTSLAIREAAGFNCPSLVLKDVNSLIKDNFNGYVSENNSLSYAQRIISSLNEINKDKVGNKAKETLAIPYEQIVDDLYKEYMEIIKHSKKT